VKKNEILNTLKLSAMKKASILITLLVIHLGALMAQGNELAENTPVKSQTEIINQINSHAPVSFKLYPNPVVSSMVVEPQLQSAAGTLRILNSDGEIMSERRVETGSNRLIYNLDTYVSGTYILALYSESGKLLYLSRFDKN
jgi:hypothetical protein